MPIKTFYPGGVPMGRANLSLSQLFIIYLNGRPDLKFIAFVYHSSRRDGSRAKRLMILELSLCKRSSRKTFTN